MMKFLCDMFLGFFMWSWCVFLCLRRNATKINKSEHLRYLEKYSKISIKEVEKMLEYEIGRADIIRQHTRQKFLSQSSFALGISVFISVIPLLYNANISPPLLFYLFISLASIQYLVAVMFAAAAVSTADYFGSGSDFYAEVKSEIFYEERLKIYVGGILSQRRENTVHVKRDCLTLSSVRVAILFMVFAVFSLFYYVACGNIFHSLKRLNEWAFHYCLL